MEGRARPTRGRSRPLASISIDSVDPTNISPGGVPPADLPANTHSQPRPDTYLLTLEPAELKLRAQKVLAAAGSELTSSGLAQDRTWGTNRLLQRALELTEELSHPSTPHVSVLTVPLSAVEPPLTHSICVVFSGWIRLVYLSCERCAAGSMLVAACSRENEPEPVRV